MRRLTHGIILSFSVALWTACGQTTEEPVPAPAPPSRSPASAVAEVELPTPPIETEGEDQGLSEGEQAQLKAQFAAEAEKAITAKNAEAVADALDKEITAELAVEE